MPQVSDGRSPKNALLSCLRMGADAGFTIVEVLVAISVLLIGMLGSVAAFDLIVSSIKKTEGLSAANAAIDDDIARIKSLSLEYTSCVNPVGSVPSQERCDVPQGQSKYYFPKSSSVTEQNKFFVACRATDPGAHITANFMKEIKNLPALQSGVVRKDPVREASSNASNHTVIIEYLVNGSVVRLIKVAPVVSAWCG